MIWRTFLNSRKEKPNSLKLLSICLSPDLCGVRVCCRLSESHASSHRPQVCQQSGGDQVLRPGHVSPTWVLKAQSDGSVSFLFLFARFLYSPGCCERVLLETRPGRDSRGYSSHLTNCFSSAEYLTPSFSQWTYLIRVKRKYCSIHYICSRTSVTCILLKT